MSKPIRTAIHAFANANGTTVYTFFTPVATGTAVRGIVATSTDTVDRVLNLYYWTGTFDLLVGSCNIPAGAGSNGIDSVDVMENLKEAGIWPWEIKTGLFRAGMASAVTLTKSVYVFYTGLDL